MARAGLGKQEWEILRHIVENHPATVRDVAHWAAETQGLARTTILTVMERLRQKRYLKRRKVDGVFQYLPQESAADLEQGMIRKFIDETLQGTMSPFFAYMSESSNVSDEELAELKQLVKDLEKQRKEGQP